MTPIVPTRKRAFQYSCPAEGRHIFSRMGSAEAENGREVCGWWLAVGGQGPVVGGQCQVATRFRDRLGNSCQKSQSRVPEFDSQSRPPMRQLATFPSQS
jgi:hypothetical protein